jgi:signal transduction histidine kinase
MKIAQKLGLLVGSLLVAMLALIAGLSLQIVHVAGDYDDLLNGQVARRAQARSLQVAFQKQIVDYKNVLLSAEDSEALTTNLAQANATAESVNKLTTSLVAASTNDRIKASLVQFQTTHTAMDIIYKATFQGLADGRLNVTTANAAVTGQDAFPSDLIDSALSQSQVLVNDSIAAQKDAVKKDIGIIVALSLLLLLVAAAAATIAIRNIVRPVRALTAAAIDAANNRLPRVVAQIATLADDAATPALPNFKVTTRDELAELATALTSLQDSAVGLALDQRRNEQANSETLVNLGRRNQSLLTRMLSYVTELEREERDSDVLDKLFRLDHLTTRIRRNAESLLVLAGAKQTRTWSQPIAIDDVLRAALSEIEEYTRVTIHHVDTARVHGGVAADLTHMLAELLENATRFSPRERQVLVVGRLTPSGYQFDLIDAGLGMDQHELEEANSRIAQAGSKRPDTKVLGHHVVGRIAARRGIFVRLLPSVQTGITAQVLVPMTLLSDAVASPEGPAPIPVPEPTKALAAEPAPAPAPAPAVPTAAPTAAPSLPSPRPSALPDRQPAAAQPTQPAAQPLVSASADLPGRRVPGAQLDGLGDTVPEAPRAPRDATEVRSQFSAMQSGIAAARREFTPQPLPYEPAQTVAESSPVPVRRVRGAQLAELGDDIIPDAPLPARDPAAIRGQLSGLQAATTRARLETAQYAPTDDTFGSNA